MARGCGAGYTGAHCQAQFIQAHHAGRGADYTIAHDPGAVYTGVPGPGAVYTGAHNPTAAMTVPTVLVQSTPAHMTLAQSIPDPPALRCLYRGTRP